MISGSVKKSRSSTFIGWLLPRRRLFPRSGQSVQVEDGWIELDVGVEGGIRTRLDAGHGGAIHLEVLDALVGLVRTLVVVHLPVRAGEGDRIPSQDLVDGEQFVLPSELTDPGALVGDGVDIELELAVQVVLVPRYALDDPELALGERCGAGRRPGDTLPGLVHVANERNVGPLGVPALALDTLGLPLALQVRLFREPQLVGLSYDLPLEVLDLAVEERSVVRAFVRAEEAVRTVGRRGRAHAAHRGHVCPGRVALGGVAVAPGEGDGAVQVGRPDDLREVPVEKVVGVRRW